LSAEVDAVGAGNPALRTGRRSSPALPHLRELVAAMTDPTQTPNVADGYNADTARHYLAVHRSSWSRRLSSWCEIGLARCALRLAGNPESVLDMPCGAGRFWPMLAKTSARRLLAGNQSPAMLAAATAGAVPEVLARFEVSSMDAFALPLADAAVDHVLCMRLIHHFPASIDRLRIFREIHRVARTGATISVWVDGNLQAWHRRHQEGRRESWCRAGNMCHDPIQIEPSETARSGW
jgi:SAM-dependent methyltransferase